MAYYATANDMLRYFGAIEMAQRSANEAQPVVPGPLFELTVQSGDRSAYTPDEQNNADAALTRLNQVLVDSSEIVGSYIRSVADIDDPAWYTPESVRRATADIARFYLYDDGRPPDIEKQHDRQVMWLEKVAMGKVSVSPDAASGTLRIMSLERS